jgi:DNA repair exonuclease SbcCD ATPase subunit
MLFIELVIPLVFINIFSEVNTQKCDLCKARTFSQKLEACICPEKQFCNKTVNTCSDCGNCFTIWDKVIEQRKDDIESILRALEKKYEVDLNELRKLLKTLSEDLQKREKELNRLRNFSDKVDNNISKETKAIKKLKEDVQKVEDLLKLIGSTNSHENLLKHLREIKNLITNLVQKLKKLKFQDDKANFQNIIKKLRDINNQISKMNENFPKIQKDSLNLALATEDDIQLLKSVIFKYNGSFVNGDKFRENLTKNTEWIESDLLALFNILNNYQNVSLDSDELIKNASNVRFSANETQLRLDRLLKDHKKLEDLLKVIKSEIIFYQDVKDVQQRVNSLINGLKRFRRLLEAWYNKKKLYKELELLRKERNALIKKETQIRRYRERMDKLLQQKDELITKYEVLENVKSISELENDIAAMIQEIKKITNEVTSHCASSTSASRTA